MFKPLLALVLICRIAGAEPVAEEARLLSGIETYAIRLGTGPTKIYAFVDPLCPRSREFVATLSGSGAMLSKNSYYLFLYRLPRFDSDALIRTIYTATDPRQMLYSVMVNHCAPLRLQRQYAGDAETTASRVADVAEKLKVTRRPYLMVFKPGAI